MDPIIGGILAPIATKFLGGLFGGDEEQSAPPQTANYNPWYDQTLQQTLMDRTKTPAGFVKPEDYNFMGQQVRPGAMKQYGDFSSTMDPMLQRVLGNLQNIQGSGVGYQGSEIQAMYDTMTRKLNEQANKSRMQVGGSMAARGLRGGAMNNAMLSNENNIMDVNRQGVRDILLGAAEARRNDTNQKFGLINNALGQGIDITGKQATFQTDANQKNINTWNNLADPMAYQKYITDTLLKGMAGGAAVGQVGVGQTNAALTAAQNNANNNSNNWGGLIWGADRAGNGIGQPQGQPSSGYQAPVSELMYTPTSTGLNFNRTRSATR